MKIGIVLLLSLVFAVGMDRVPSNVEQTVSTFSTIEPPSLETFVIEDNLNENTLIETTSNIEFPKEDKQPEAKSKSKKIVNIRSSQNLVNHSLHEKLRKEGNALVAEKVLFDFDTYELKSNEEFNRILQLADKLIFDPSLKISIAGNTDNIGTDYYNEVLSYNRVENIKTYLLELGVSADQIIVSFNGEQHPQSDNDTEEGRSLNRNVEMFVYQ